MATVAVGTNDKSGVSTNQSRLMDVDISSELRLKDELRFGAESEECNQ